MAGEIISGSRTLRTLLPQQVRSNAPGEGYTLDKIAGNLRWLREYIDGDNESSLYGVINQCAPPTPLNGNVLPGHDHSGGIMGVPQRHTVWQHAWGEAENTSIINHEAPRTTEPVGSGPWWVIRSKVGPAWVPPGSIYRALQPTVIIRVVTASCDVEVTAERDGASVTLSGTYAVGQHSIALPLLAVTPGAFNLWTLSVYVATWGASAEVYLLHHALHQIHDEPVPVITP
jgi:hypothetical protein